MIRDLEPPARLRFTATLCAIVALVSACGTTEPEAEYDPLEITSLSLGSGVEGQPFSATLSASGGDGVYGWSVISGSLPAGLSLAGSTGVISGAPTTVGNATFTLRAVSGDGQSDSVELTLSVYGELAITVGELPDGTQNASYEGTITTRGGDGSVTWSLVSGVLPNGLEIDSVTGMVSGTPTTPYAGSFTVSAESGDGQSAEGTVSLTIHGQLVIGTSSLVNGRQGVPYFALLQASGGDGSSTWTVTNGALPLGLELDEATGEIEGTPTELGPADFTVQVESGDGQATTSNLTITVYELLVLSTDPLRGATYGAAYADTLFATGGDGDHTWIVSGFALPDGIGLSGATGVLSGTPTSVGDIVFGIEVQSGDGQGASALFTIAVAPPTLAADEDCAAYPPSSVATFADANLEAAVRSSLGVPAGTVLTCQQLESVQVVTAESAGVSDLTGAQNLVDLTVAYLASNAIIDISPLANLPELEHLELWSNAIGDLPSMSGATSLRRLRIFDNDISDLSPLAGLTTLQHLQVGRNELTGIGPVSTLTGLTLFQAEGNDITDVSALGDLPAISLISLSDNASLSDIQPLIDHPTFPSGGRMFLDGTNVTCASIAALDARGVITYSDCLEPTELCAGQPSMIATFEDPALASAIRSSLGLTVDDPLRCNLVESMTTLYASSAGATDVTGIQNAVGLTTLDLSGNPGLSNIQSLLDNTGIGSGDTIDLTGTGVACTDVDTLRATGATVTSPCP